MRIRGIHYDVGTTTLEGGSTRPTLDLGQIERELTDIANGLHANAVRVTGESVERLAVAARIAANLGLEAWLSPMVPNADPSVTLARIEETASMAAELMEAGHATVVVVGCELSAFMSGIIPGQTHTARLELLSDLDRLVAEVTAQGFDPQERFEAFLADAIRVTRSRFAGPVTYASGTWEQVDWTGFDLVGVDAYRDAGTRAGYLEMLRSQMRHGRPVVITEVGCATFRGAADFGSLGWTAIERSGGGRRLKGGIVRDEAEQATEVGSVLDLLETAGIEGTFIYTYVAPSYPSIDEAAQDLDAASFALVRSWPDGRTEPKAAFHAVAARYGVVP